MRTGKNINRWEFAEISVDWANKRRVSLKAATIYFLDKLVLLYLVVDLCAELTSYQGLSC